VSERERTPVTQTPSGRSLGGNTDCKIGEQTQVRSVGPKANNDTMSAPMDDQLDAPSAFGLELEELRELMKLRKAEGYETIQTKYGGVMEMCKKLYTSANEGTLALTVKTTTSKI